MSDEDRSDQSCIACTYDRGVITQRCKAHSRVTALEAQLATAQDELQHAEVERLRLSGEVEALHVEGKYLVQAAEDPVEDTLRNFLGDMTIKHPVGRVIGLVEALQQQIGEVVIVAIYELFGDIQPVFNEFMETGPESGIEEKFRDLVHERVLQMDAAREASEQ